MEPIGWSERREGPCFMRENAPTYVMSHPRCANARTQARRDQYRSATPGFSIEQTSRSLLRISGEVGGAGVGDGRIGEDVDQRGAPAGEGAVERAAQFAGLADELGVAAQRLDDGVVAGL